MLATKYRNTVSFCAINYLESLPNVISIALKNATLPSDEKKTRILENNSNNLPIIVMGVYDS